MPQLGHAGKHHPDVGGDIARREAEGVLDMSFRGQADGSVGGRQISVQCQSALALSDALSNSVCLDLNDAQGAISLGMVRCQGQSFEYGLLRGQACGPAVTNQDVGGLHVSPRRAD